MQQCNERLKHMHVSHCGSLACFYINIPHGTQQWRSNVRMTTSVRSTKTSLERGFRLSFFTFTTVSGLHLVDLNNFLPNRYIIMYGSVHYLANQLITQS